MSSGPDERILKAAETLADGGTVDWDELVRERPDLAPVVNRLRQLHAISIAHGESEVQGGLSPTATGSEPRLFNWGAIEVIEKLGEGAFAEVYRAWDPALEREVALKLSRIGAEGDATRVERWLAEARRLARVRHSNVLVIHGVDVREGRAGIWTDLIHGRTLERALQEQGRLGGAEAALIGLELCRALAAVHAAGLVHGDLKASNVMREGQRDRDTAAAAGRIVLMDFGAAGESSPSDARSATFVTPLTCAPEVLRGEPPTAESDLYSLGALLYRLVTGRYPIESRDLAELETKIQYGVRTPLRDLRPDLETTFVAVVERALDPDPARRFSSAGQMERGLSEAQKGESASAQGPLDFDRDATETARGAAPARRGQRSRTLLVTTALLIGGASIGVALWIRTKSPESGPMPIHFTVQAPPGTQLTIGPNNLAISPDGTKLAFMAFDSAGRTNLWVRRLGTRASYMLTGTEGARAPFWSPNGTEIGFFSDGKMKRVRADGGGVEAICDAPHPRGGTWGRRGVIVFSPTVPGPLFQVPAGGGSATAVTTVDSTSGANEHVWPSFLPDGEHFIYVTRRPLPPYQLETPVPILSFASYIGSIRSRRSEPLLVASSAPMFAAPHYLIYVRDRVLVAQPFDARRRRLTGRPFPIRDAPAPVAFVGSRCGSVSTNGVLVGLSARGPKTKMVWIDRDGNTIATVGIPDDRWVRASISPDGGRAILQRNLGDGSSDLWVMDLRRETVVRLTSAAGSSDGGAWSPDGKDVIYAARGPGGVGELRRCAVDVPGSDRSFYRSSARLQNAFGWSPDGRWVLVEENAGPRGFDLLIVPSTGGEAKTYMATPFNERRAEISPDGKWVLYCSNESGPTQAYVASFPRPGKKQQVSPLPGAMARWCRQGREILLFSSDFKVRAIPVERGDPLRLGAAQELFQLPRTTGWLDPAPDGQRFLVLQSPDAATGASIAVNANWMAGLER